MQDLERDLGSFDFSQFSGVRDRLLAELLAMHRQDRRRRLMKKKVSNEELDYVTAAGLPQPVPERYNRNKSSPWEEN